jgi:hypothetical protein
MSASISSAQYSVAMFERVSERMCAKCAHGSPRARCHQDEPGRSRPDLFGLRTAQLIQESAPFFIVHVIPPMRACEGRAART